MEWLTGETAAYGLTNGVYASCESFKTVKRPMATLMLLHSSMPLSVVGDVLREQQRLWVAEHRVEFAKKLPRGARWPREVAYADRITHHDGERYVVQLNRSAWIHWSRGQGDLPVYRENSAKTPSKHNQDTGHVSQNTAFMGKPHSWGPATHSTPGLATWTRKFRA